jgi:hypothetical protein
VLAGSGKEVVIKVLRPGTEDVLLTDLNFVSMHTNGQTADAAAVSAGVGRPIKLPYLMLLAVTAQGLLMVIILW